jgi:septal ring factor EnvC (AmiA/AmiB activator)
MVKNRMPRAGALALGIAALAPSACLVPQARVEEADARAASERTARETAEGQLGALGQQLSQIQQALRRAEQRLDDCSQRLAQVDYDTAVIVKERDDSKELVAQLRDELDRVARHLQAFGEKNRELGQALAQMQTEAERLERAEADADQRAQLLRDLSLELEKEAKRGAVSLAMSGGAAVVKLTPARVLTRDRMRLTPSGRAIVRAVGKLVGPLDNSRVELFWGGVGAHDERQGRLGPVVDGLVRAGISQKRISISSQTALARAESKDWIEIVVRRTR